MPYFFNILCHRCETSCCRRTTVWRTALNLRRTRSTPSSLISASSVNTPSPSSSTRWTHCTCNETPKCDRAARHVTTPCVTIMWHFHMPCDHSSNVTFPHTTRQCHKCHVWHHILHQHYPVWLYTLRYRTTYAMWWHYSCHMMSACDVKETWQWYVFRSPCCCKLVAGQPDSYMFVQFTERY